jgi:hypothetical protein
VSALQTSQKMFSGFILNPPKHSFKAVGFL